MSGNPKAARWALFASFLMLAATARATDYYLDGENGSDKSPGTKPDAAWRTLEPLARLTLKPGDSVRFRRGSTFRGRLAFRGNGAKGKPITLTAYGEGPKPEILGSVRPGKWERHGGEVYKTVLPVATFWGKKRPCSVFEYPDGGVPKRLTRADGVPTKRGTFFFDPKTWTLYVVTRDGAPPGKRNVEVCVIEMLVDLRARSWIVIEDLTLLFGNCRHVVMRECKDILIRRCASMFVGYYGNPNICMLDKSERVAIEDCFLYENVNCGILFSRLATRCAVRRCVIVKCKGNDGVTLHVGGRRGDPAGLCGDHNVVEDNVIGLCPEESIDITSGDYHVIRRNICYGNGNPGIIVGHDSDHNLIENNICFGNRHAGIMISGQPAQGGRGENRVIGNLCFDNGFPAVEIQGRKTYVYNNTLLNSRNRVVVRINAAGRESVIRNNIIANLDPAIRPTCLHIIGGDPKQWALTFSNNLYYHAKNPKGPEIITNSKVRTFRYRPESFRKAFGQGQGSLVAAPKLVEKGAHYYFLGPDSPAVGAGADVGLPFKGKAPDLGWKQRGNEGSAPKYPEVLITGHDEAADDAAVLYLWGKVKRPPAPKPLPTKFPNPRKWARQRKRR